MCGIIGISSNKSVSASIICSLKKLEYRGYDSAGIATLSEGFINEVKTKGRVENLEKNFDLKSLSGNIGIGSAVPEAHVSIGTGDADETLGTGDLYVASDVEVDGTIYGTLVGSFIVGDDFSHMWVSALAHCQKRFSGQIPKYKNEPSGGIGAFTPDSFPVFDKFKENCFVIADSNHGYKMLGVGKLVAETICGKKSELLKPFRYSRYAEGDLHPVSNSPFPWS